MTDLAFSPLPVPASRLGESPFWHPQEQALYWCDIPGRQLNRWTPARQDHQRWAFETEPACCAPHAAGGLVLGMRDGLWHFDPDSGQRRLLAPPPYDPAVQRFNDGKADRQGRFWVGTIHEPRQPALAALYCWSSGQLTHRADGITVSNGLAWSPAGDQLYWSDTTTHRIRRYEMDVATGALGSQTLFAGFPIKQPNQSLDDYGGRPDGAAVDSEGCYWVAMFEGQRLLRLSPDGVVLRDVRLPVRCATMLCFGGDDLRTLFVTTAREGRPEAELQAQPWAGCVLQARVEVPGLPVDAVRP